MDDDDSAMVKVKVLLKRLIGNAARQFLVTPVGRDVSKSLRINSHASIFTAELVAVNLSLDIIRRSKRKKFAIFSDSLSSH